MEMIKDDEPRSVWGGGVKLENLLNKKINPNPELITTKKKQSPGQ